MSSETPASSMRREIAYLRDALKAIQEARQLREQTTREAFLQDKMRQSFLFHRLVILGEASVSLSRTFQGQFPNIPWARLVGMRNRLVHAYFDLDMEILWDIADTHLQELESQLEHILGTEFPGEPGTE